MAESSARPRRTRKILVSILALLFLVGLIPLLWTSYTLVSRSQEILEADQRALQHDKVAALSNHVQTYIDGLRSQLATIARTLAIGSSSGQLQTRIDGIRLGSDLEIYLEGETPFIYLAVVDPQGRGARSGVNLPQLQDLLQTAWNEGMEGRASLSSPVVSEELQEPVLVLGQPIRSGDSMAGVVVGVASLGKLWSFTGILAESGTYEIYLVDPEGNVFAHSEPERLQNADAISRSEIVTHLLNAGGHARTTMPFTLQRESGAVQMLGTYQRVPGGLDWGVVVQIEEARAYVTVAEMSRESKVLVSGVAILAVLLGIVFAGQITRPIRALERGARRLAAKEYDTRVKTDARNELGVLADTFNLMGEEIQKAIEEIRQAAARNKELFMGSIRMLANAIDEKDPYTRGHSERVAWYSKMIAKHMGMSEEDVERVHLSGIIHDVGKIGIEDKILRKAAALTDDEYEIMKQHPTKGEHILEAVPMLKEMAGAGLQHHENVDGSGYPDGLKGDEIPLLGRIVSVADAFDAMTTDRPYSKAMTYEAALARLRMLIGKKFDGPCVEAMERAAAAGDLAPGKATRAAVAARRQAS